MMAFFSQSSSQWSRGIQLLCSLMFLHELGQDFVLQLNLFFQFLDPPFLLGLMLLAAVGYMLKRRRPVLEKLL